MVLLMCVFYLIYCVYKFYDKEYMQNSGSKFDLFSTLKKVIYRCATKIN